MSSSRKLRPAQAAHPEPFVQFEGISEDHRFEQAILEDHLIEWENHPTCVSDLLQTSAAQEVLLLGNVFLVRQLDTTVRLFEQIIEPWLIEQRVHLERLTTRVDAEFLETQLKHQPGPCVIIVDMLRSFDLINRVLVSLFQVKRSATLRPFGVCVLGLPSHTDHKVLAEFQHFFIPASSRRQLEFIQEVIPLSPQKIAQIAEKPDQVLFYSLSAEKFGTFDNPVLLRIE